MINILFDVDGVLIHGYHAKTELTRRWDENLEEVFGISCEAFNDAFFEPHFVPHVLTGQRDLQDALAEVLPTVGYTGDVRAFIQYWMEQDSVLHEPIMAHVRELGAHEHVRLFLCTNQEHVRAQHLMKVVGLENYFEDIFYAARFGCVKPERGFFEKSQEILERNNAFPVVFYDDRQEIVDAANAFGWEAHQYDGPEDLWKSEKVGQLLGKSAS